MEGAGARTAFAGASATEEKELPVLPLYFYVSKQLVNTKVKGWVDNPFDVHHVRDLSLAD